MPRILHLIPTFSGGGAERQLSLLAAEQGKRGWDVHIGIRRGGVHAETLCSLSGVVVHLLGDHRGLNPLLFVSVHKLIKRIKPDVIQTWLPQMDIVGGIGALWNSIPWIISERASGKAYLGFRYQIRIRRYLARYADAIVANSRHGVKYWRELLPANSRIFQVANAVDIEVIRSAPPSVIDSKSSKVCTKNLLIVGRLAPEKAVDIVIQAISMDSIKKSVGAWIIGEGPLRADIENKIREACLGDRVLLFSYRQDWWGLLKSATALVSMSRFEGQPNVVLEAMAAGCPVIVSDIPEHREILDEDSAIFVQPENPAELAKAIEMLLSKPDAALYRAERAFNHVSGMTIKSTANEYESIFEKVLSGVNK